MFALFQYSHSEQPCNYCAGSRQFTRDKERQTDRLTDTQTEKSVGYYPTVRTTTSQRSRRKRRRRRKGERIKTHMKGQIQAVMFIIISGKYIST